MQITWFGTPETRAKALAAGAKYYFTGKLCKHGHLSRRHTKDRKCLECDRLYALKRQARDPERERAIFAAWREQNRERTRETKRKSMAKAPEKWRERNQRYWRLNKEVESVKNKAWRIANRHVVYAINAKRRAAELRGTPPWASRYADKFKAIYAESIRLSNETGIKHHVDHIYPLRGKNSCGLHVPWNLRVVTATENLSKRNRDPEATITMSQMESGLRFQCEAAKTSAVRAD